MRPVIGFVFMVLCSLLLARGVASATEQEVSLASVARAADLQYGWLAAERAVQLSGPGLVLVLRPGDPLYEVNDRVEVAAVTPRYAQNDIYVSAALAKHIERLAGQAWYAFTGAQEELARQAMSLQNSTILPQLHGSIVLHVQPLKGAEALLVTGEAPPSAPVRITLLATLSSDIPNVLLSRNDLTSSTQGTFQAVVPIAPDFLRGSFIHVLATSVPGVTSASAQILVDAPNAGLVVPAEVQPTGIY